MFRRTRLWNDDQMRSIMGKLLRLGVLSSAFLVISGGILFFFEHPGESFNYSHFMGEPDRLKHFYIIFKEAFELRSRSIIQLGLFLLISTPVARVIFSLIGFLFEKDWVYVSITPVVILILFYSIFCSV